MVDGDAGGDAGVHAGLTLPSPLPLSISLPLPAAAKRTCLTLARMLSVKGEVTLFACRLHRFSEKDPSPVSATTYSAVPPLRLSQSLFSPVTSPKATAKNSIWHRASGAILDNKCNGGICGRRRRKRRPRLNN